MNVVISKLKKKKNNNFKIDSWCIFIKWKLNVVKSINKDGFQRCWAEKLESCVSINWGNIKRVGWLEAGGRCLVSGMSIHATGLSFFFFFFYCKFRLAGFRPSPCRERAETATIHVSLSILFCMTDRCFTVLMIWFLFYRFS